MSDFVQLPAALFRRFWAKLLGMSHNGNRDLYESFGYPRDLTYDHFAALYYRGGIANRIVRAFPQATWRDAPVIRDEAGDSAQEKDAKGNKNPKYSPFVEAVEDLFEKKRILAYLERVDRMAGIGQYGVLVVGLGGGKLDAAITTAKQPLLYLAPYSEKAASIAEWEKNTSNERYGLPVMYQIQQPNPVAGGTSMGGSFRVHHSRCIHVAELVEENEVLGVPRLMAAFNDLMDLSKVTGAGAETFWLNARPGVNFSIDKDASISDDDKAAMKTQVEEFTNQLRRYMTTQGVTAQQLNAMVADPKPNVETLLQLIAGATGIPQRILVGSERGQLSSDQDENNWSERIDERRKNFAGPMMLRPFIDLMIATGNLPEPEGEYWVEWPASGALSADKMADVAVKRAQAISTYANSPSSELVVPVQEFRKDILGLEPESEYDATEELDPIDETDPNAIDQFGKTRGGDQTPEDEEVAANAKPKPLYVYRRVLNADEILKWAKAQGFKSTMPADELHVTIAYSPKPFDWMKVSDEFGEVDGKLTIAPGGPRVVEPLGPKGAIVLMFNSWQLTYRHGRIRKAGAEWKYGDEYQPHVTITYDGTGVDLEKIEPYAGKIELGPEMFVEIEKDWSDQVKEVSAQIAREARI